MGLFGDIGKDIRGDWATAVNSKQAQKMSDPSAPVSAWPNMITGFEVGGKFLFHAASSVVLESFHALGTAMAGSTVQGDGKKKDDDSGGDDSGGHGSDNMYSGQAVGQYDTYSNYYTNNHENTLIHAPSGDVTLYAFNNIPITTNGTNSFAHLTDWINHLLKCCCIECTVRSVVWNSLENSMKDME